MLVTARALVDELGIIITQIRKHNRSIMAAVYGTPCAIPPRNSNSVIHFENYHPDYGNYRDQDITFCSVAL
jgi:hypothetical protein